MAEPVGDCSCGRSLWLNHDIEGSRLWFCDTCGRIWCVDPVDGLCEVAWDHG